MTLIALSLKGVTETFDTLQKVERFASVNDILDEAQALMLNRTRTRFLAQQSPDGVQWIPSKAAIKEGRATLFKTGNLFHSLQAYKAGPDVRAIGTDVPYAFKHQFGIGVIQRRFLGFNPEDVTLMEARLVQRFAEMVI